MKGDIVFNKPDNAKEQLKELESEEKEIGDSIKSIDQKWFFDERYRLIKKLLTKNGIDDEYYLSRDFWDDDIDASVSATFLDTVIYKDVQGEVKKKAKKK